MPQLPSVLQSPLSPNVELLLDSAIPARMAWVDGDGHPRVVPIWFHWTGEKLAVATFKGAQKLDQIAAGQVVAVTIDSQTFPYRGLKIRGPVELVENDGLSPEYREAAVRYLGPNVADRWCESLAHLDQVTLLITPKWASASDMSDAPFLKETP